MNLAFERPAEGQVEQTQAYRQGHLVARQPQFALHSRPLESQDIGFPPRTVECELCLQIGGILALRTPRLCLRVMTMSLMDAG